ncbi:hypothetical protein [Staphylococcus pseudintermedius]|uniref:hypothetical protein n=1 Tax=Staphylococcus pseudintermedius TaxID=283734 RepID=UPI001F5B0D8F
MMFAGQDGKAAERSASQDVGVVAKQQELSLYQQKDGDEPTRHDAPTAVNHERETTEKASVDHLHIHALQIQQLYLKNSTMKKYMVQFHPHREFLKINLTMPRL